VQLSVNHRCFVQDTEDDIRAVASDALLPASAAIVAGQSSVLAQLKGILWDTLLTLEDLSLSTGQASSPRKSRFPFPGNPGY